MWLRGNVSFSPPPTRAKGAQPVPISASWAGPWQQHEAGDAANNDAGGDDDAEQGPSQAAEPARGPARLPA